MASHRQRSDSRFFAAGSLPIAANRPNYRGKPAPRAKAAYFRRQQSLDASRDELSVEPRTAAAILAKVWFDTNDSRDVSAGELAFIEDLAEMAAAVDAQRLGAGIGVSELSEKDNIDVGLAALRGSAKVWARKNVPDSLRSSLVPAERLLEIANDKNSDAKDRAAAVSLLAFDLMPPATCFPLPKKAATRESGWPRSRRSRGKREPTPGNHFWISLLPKLPHPPRHSRRPAFQRRSYQVPPRRHRSRPDQTQRNRPAPGQTADRKPRRLY